MSLLDAATGTVYCHGIMPQKKRNCQSLASNADEKKGTAYVCVSKQTLKLRYD